MKKTLSLALVSIGLALSGCSDAEDLYAPLPARFNYNLVATTPPLLNALTGNGQFCTISYTVASQSSYIYTFSGMTGGTYTSTAQSVTINGEPRSVAGFIVGTPSMMDLSGQLLPIAFDRVCPNCYENDLMERTISFSDQVGHAQCSRCLRIYDLNNGGIVSSGSAGKKLYRYHISASTTNVSIYN